MASLRLLLALAIFVTVASGQEEEGREYVPLTGAQLRELELTQNPELLEFAAMTGETVFIRITGAQSGAILSERVNAYIDCLPWLQQFPGGSIQWIRQAFDPENASIPGKLLANMNLCQLSNIANCAVC